MDTGRLWDDHLGQLGYQPKFYRVQDANFTNSSNSGSLFWPIFSKKHKNMCFFEKKNHFPPKKKRPRQEAGMPHQSVYPKTPPYFFKKGLKLQKWLKLLKFLLYHTALSWGMCFAINLPHFRLWLFASSWLAHKSADVKVIYRLQLKAGWYNRNFSNFSHFSIFLPFFQKDGGVGGYTLWSSPGAFLAGAFFFSGGDFFEKTRFLMFVGKNGSKMVAII